MRIKLAYPMTLGEFASATKSTLNSPHSNEVIYYISTDSREIFPGDLFVALKGEKYDGEAFVTDIIKNGAFHISKSHLPYGIKTDDTREALLKLAKYYKSKLRYLRHTIGITGSVGKTTTKEFAKVILSQKYSVSATNENLNNTLGVPLTLLSAQKDTEILLIEMGMNSMGEISKSSICISPNISIILNVGNSHVGMLGSREKIAKAKLEILDGMENGTLLVPLSEPLLKKTNALFWDRFNTDADFYFGNSDKLDLFVGGALYSRLNFRLKAWHLMDCLLAACACGVLSGLEPDELKRGVFNISEENTRQKIVKVEDFYFLTDFYNSSPESITAAFDSLFMLRPYIAKSVLLGDILELGEQSEQLHREVGERFAKYNFRNLYLLGKYSKNIFDGATSRGFPKNRIFINEDAENHSLTVDQIKENHVYGEIILMKASRGLRLERILNSFGESIK